jgi:thiamine-monophosphate kinase
MAERDLIQWLRQRITPPAHVAVGPGDDAAVFHIDGQAVVSADAFLEGTHFAADDAPQHIGHKVMAASISDIAAMGCHPVAAFVTVGLGRTAKPGYVEAFAEALIRTGERYGAPLMGGDVTSWDAPLTVSVTVIGETRGLTPVLRSGAKPGDVLFVTGRLGGSLLGRHLVAEPRIKAGLFLNREIGVSAMIDLSDGLSTDLGHLARESGVGAVVREAALPIAETARQAETADGIPALFHALNDGEDFELLFTLPANRVGLLRERWPFELRLTEIGIIEGKDVRLERADGQRARLEPGGYEHHWSQS